MLVDSTLVLMDAAYAAAVVDATADGVDVDRTTNVGHYCPANSDDALSPNWRHKLVPVHLLTDRSSVDYRW